MTNNPLPLEFFEAFVRGLAHQLRTPLSTISNELHYLGALTRPEEVERSSTKCKEIAGVLNKIQMPSIGIGSTREPLSKLLQAIKADLHTPECYCNCALETTQYALLLVRDYVMHCVDNTNERVDMSAYLQDNLISLSLTVDGFKDQRYHGNFQSLTKYSLVVLERDAHFPALAEAIFIAQNFTTALTSAELLTYTISIPITHD
ncbi:MAG: hypothetical protein KDD62_00380 [Bdellovibrionales bacterium]|nr:hypothetical protein [Bdellovibrionales bacterium]